MNTGHFRHWPPRGLPHHLPLAMNHPPLALDAPTPPELLERGPVQLQLSQLLHAAAQGSGSLVFLGGEAGVGKTSLVHRFAELIRGQARVLEGAADPVATPRPLGPLYDMREDLGVRFATTLDRTGPREEIFRHFLAEIGADERPSLVVVEDVHWADEATLDLLRFLARRIGTARALLVATFRSEEVGDRHPLRIAMGDIATYPAVRRLELEPLSLAAVRTLIAGTDLDAVALHRQTGGNPFYVTEVLESAGDGIPAVVRDAVLARAGRLEEKERAALGVAAVLGFRFEESLLEAMIGEDPGLIEACIGSGMLRRVGERLQFRHELAREAVLETVPAGRRREIHARALEAFRASGAEEDFGRLAQHAEGAGDVDAVLEYAPKAAKRALELRSNREAVAHFERALRYADRVTPPERAELLAIYSYACASTDQFDAAIRADREILQLWQQLGDPRKEGWAHNYLASCLFSIDDLTGCRQANAEAIRILEALEPGPELAGTYALHAALELADWALPAAIDYAERALRIADAGDFGVQRAMARTRLGAARILSGDPAGEADLLAAIDESRRLDTPWQVVGACTYLGSALIEVGEFQRGVSYLDDGLRVCMERDIEAFRPYIQSWRSLALVRLGRWDEAEEAANEPLRYPRISEMRRLFARVAVARLRSYRGAVGAAEELDLALVAAEANPTPSRLALVRCARAEVAWYAGDPEAAEEELSAALPLVRESSGSWFADEVVLWRHRAGLGVDVPVTPAGPQGLEIAGDFDGAAAEWTHRGCVYDAALVRLNGDDPEALGRALETFRALGSSTAERMAERRLRALGRRAVPRGPRPSTRQNPAHLTTRQVEILELLSRGSTNADIARTLYLSPKTVGHHVSAVLEKLGARTRTEAVREGARLGIVEIDG